MSSPLVSIVTPVYNGEEYLVECIESVLAQSYGKWEYLIVDNCSTDRSREIASGYAKNDPRIRVFSYTEFVTLVQNFNRAVSLISPESAYCKVLSADDWLFPNCIEKFVEHGEANPSVGIIGSYQLSGGDGSWCIKWDGIEFPSDRIPGPDICRWHLLAKGYVFGTPTSTIYRSDLVRNARPFFPGPPSTMHSDTSACYEHLQHCDFGFVHQVLSFERVHEAAASTTVRGIHSYTPGILRDLLTYGRTYLNEEDFGSRLNEVINQYYGLLASGILKFRGPEFWRYHRDFLSEIGYPLFTTRLAVAVLLRLADKILNPKRTLESVVSERSRARAAQLAHRGKPLREAVGGAGNGDVVSESFGEGVEPLSSTPTSTAATDLER